MNYIIDANQTLPTVTDYLQRFAMVAELQVPQPVRRLSHKSDRASLYYVALREHD